MPHATQSVLSLRGSQMRRGTSHAPSAPGPRQPVRSIIMNAKESIILNINWCFFEYLPGNLRGYEAAQAVVKICSREGVTCDYILKSRFLISKWRFFSSKSRFFSLQSHPLHIARSVGLIWLYRPAVHLAHPVAPSVYHQPDRALPKFIIFNTKPIIFNTQFIIFNPKFIIFRIPK